MSRRLISQGSRRRHVMAPSRVLHVNKFVATAGGVESHVHHLIAQQRLVGIEAELFSAEDVRGSTFDPGAQGLARMTSAGKLLWSPAAGAALRRALQSFRPDLVHFHGIFHHLSPSVLRAARSERVPAVMTLHDFKLAAPCYYLFRDGHQCTLCVGRAVPLPAIRYRCVKDSVAGSAVCTVEHAAHSRLYRDGVDAFVVPSDAARELLIRSRAVPAGRVAVVPHGLDLNVARTDIARAPRRMIVLGRLSPEKGIDVLLEAWRRASLPGWELLIAGDGPDRQALEAAAVGLPISFAGHLGASELAQELERVSVTLVPSLFPETFCLSAAEPMARGIPVLVSNAGNLPDLVGNSQQVLEAGDVDAWTRGLEWIAASTTDRVALGRAGRKRIEGISNPSAALNRLLAVYADARESYKAIAA